MSDEKPKLQAWNYDKLDARQSLEVKNPEPIGMSGTGKSLGNNSKEYGMPRIVILTPMVLAILAVALLYSRIFALVLEVLCFVPVIFFYDRANEKLGRGSALAFWIIFALVLAAIVWFVPIKPY